MHLRVCYRELMGRFKYINAGQRREPYARSYVVYATGNSRVALDTPTPDRDEKSPL